MPDHPLPPEASRPSRRVMWEFYLCYCEGGFLENAISDVQMLMARPGTRHGASLATR